MRTLTLYMATLVSVLGLATASQAGIIFDFLIGGESSVNAVASSSVTVDVYLTATGATTVSGYQISFVIDATELTGANSLVNFPTFPLNGSWNSSGAGLYFPGPTGYAAVLSYSTLVTPANDITSAHGQVHIGSIKFHVLAAITDGLLDITGCENCVVFSGDGSVGSGDLTASFNGAQINVIPEPTTASLLGLGLLGLTVAGRRRKN